jgi:nicotinate phosphoribosyltransferase
MPSSTPFHIASPNDIRAGKVADVTLLRAGDIVRSLGRDAPVAAEIRASPLPEGWPWAVLAGLDEVIGLLEGRDVDVEGLSEGSLFHAEEPVLTISGSYLTFAELETSLLGLLCQASGIATQAARCKRAAGPRPVYAFAARRVHPTIVPMVERAAFVGGCDGVGTVAGGEAVGMAPVGTMPHGLILLAGEEEGWRAFDRIVDPRIPRVALVDTYQDERFGALAAARALGGRLAAVCLDTPRSRRGDLAAILREVRWELDANGFPNVKILVMGGVDERRILELNRYADAYGVGAALGNAPIVDFSLDLVEVDGKPVARRGKLSGRKSLWECPECGNRGISPAHARLGHCPRCDHRVASLFDGLLARGKPRHRPRSALTVRAAALEHIEAAPDPFASVPR